LLTSAFNAQLFLSTGIFLAYLVALAVTLTTAGAWRLM
jgi:hypothetical protein